MTEVVSRKSNKQSAGASESSGAAVEASETPDHEFALVSVLYHALQGVQASEQYIEDAERSGDEELVQFFTDTRDEQAQRARRAKVLLGSRVELDDEDEEDEEDEEDDAE